jgi:hypothetical protein
VKKERGPPYTVLEYSDTVVPLLKYLPRYTSRKINVDLKTGVLRIFF